MAAPAAVGVHYGPCAETGDYTAQANLVQYATWLIFGATVVIDIATAIVGPWMLALFGIMETALAATFAAIACSILGLLFVRRRFRVHSIIFPLPAL